jgi:DNA-binding GntR family transcriptional regulator
MADSVDRSAHPLSPIEAPASLGDRVYETLKAGILGRRFPVGAKLSVPRLARLLGVSRTPVKQAIERLEHEGLVTSLPNRGAFVAIVRRDDIREIYEFREVLEELATRLAATRTDPTLLRALEELIIEGEGSCGPATSPSTRVWTWSSIG